MANITITIPDDKVADIVEAFVERYKYTVADGTKAEFAKQKVIEYIKRIYKESKVNELSNREAIKTDAETYTEGIS